VREGYSIIAAHCVTITRPATPLLLVLLFSCWCTAGEVVDTLADMIVREHRGSREFYSPYAVTILSEEEWGGSGKNLGDVLAEQSGVQSHPTGGIGSWRSLSIRGMTGNKVAVYLDGIPLTTASGGAVDLSKISLGGLESVTVYRGVVPARYSDNALGGAVQLKRKREDRNSRATLQLTAGSHGLTEYSLFAASPADAKGSVFFNTSGMHSDNTFEYIDNNSTPDNRADDVGRVRTNDEFTSFNLLSGGSRQLSPVHTIGVVGSWNRYKKGIPGTQLLHTRYAHYTQSALFCRISHAIAPANTRAGTGSWGVAYTRTDYRMSWRGSEVYWTHGLYTNTDTVTMGSVTNRIHLDGEGSFSGGDRLPWSWQLFGFGRYEQLAPHSDIPASLFTPWTVARIRGHGATSFDVTAGPLFGQLQAFGDIFGDNTAGGVDVLLRDTIDAMEDFDGYGGFAGSVQLSPVRFLTLFTGAKMHYRTPGLDEKYGGVQGVLPNPDLEPERGRLLEGGVKLKGRAGSMALTCFMNRNTDAIAFESDGRQVKARNIAASATRGLEMNGATAFGRIVTLGGSVTWQQARNQSIQYRDNAMPYEPDFAGSLRLAVGPVAGGTFTWQIDGSSFYYTTPANSSLSRVPGTFDDTPNFDVQHHATLSWRYTDRFGITTALHNLFDNTAQGGYVYYPWPGRRFSCGITISF